LAPANLVGWSANLCPTRSLHAFVSFGRAARKCSSTNTRRADDKLSSTCLLAMEVRSAHGKTPRRRDLPQCLPERFLQADAGLVPGQHHGSFQDGAGHHLAQCGAPSRSRSPARKMRPTFRSPEKTLKSCADHSPDRGRAKEKAGHGCQDNSITVLQATSALPTAVVSRRPGGPPVPQLPDQRRRQPAFPGHR
jgi:hypothetical protein